MRLWHLSLLPLVLIFAGCKATGGQKPASDGGEAEVETPVQSVDEAKAQASSDTVAAPSATAPERHGTDEGATTGGSGAATLVDASTLCNDLVDPNGEGVEIMACEFLPGGKDLSAGVRFDLLKIHFVDGAFGDLEQIYAVLRSAEESHDELVAESSEVPGESVVGTVGKIEFSPGKVTVASQEKVITIGNTGDPDADPDETVDIAKFVTSCVADDLACERESIHE